MAHLQKNRSISDPLNRRTFLRSNATALLAAGLWPGALAARASETSVTKAEEIAFIEMNDTHYRDEKCAAFFKAVVEQIKTRHTGGEKRLDFCLVAGDLATDGKEHELQPFKTILDTMPCPVHTVPGNHDFNGESCLFYEQAFPKSRNYVREIKGWNLIGLDTCDGPRWKDISVSKVTLDWMRSELPKVDKKRPTIVFTHFPLGEGVQMRPKNADEVLELLWDHNLRAIYSGHFHGRTLVEKDGVPITTNACLSFSRDNHDGTKKEGYYLCKARDGEFSRAFIEFQFEG